MCEIRKGNSLKDSFTVVWPCVFLFPASSPFTRLHVSERPSSRADHLHTCSEGLETECRKRSHFNTQYEFEAGPEKYRWRADSVNKSMYNYTVRAFLSPPRVKAECVRYLQLWKDCEMELPESERTPVAHWRTAWAAVVKAGCLLINPVGLLGWINLFHPNPG